MLFLASGRDAELREALGAALPLLYGAIGVSLLLVILAAIPPSSLPGGMLAEFLAPRRREVALIGVSICLSAMISFAIVFWVL
jgi:hypothetical protein